MLYAEGEVTGYTVERVATVNVKHTMYTWEYIIYVWHCAYVLCVARALNVVDLLHAMAPLVAT